MKKSKKIIYCMCSIIFLLSFIITKNVIAENCKLLTTTECYKTVDLFTEEFNSEMMRTALVGKTINYLDKNNVTNTIIAIMNSELLLLGYKDLKECSRKDRFLIKKWEKDYKYELEAIRMANRKGWNRWNSYPAAKGKEKLHEKNKALFRDDIELLKRIYLKHKDRFITSCEQSIL